MVEFNQIDLDEKNICKDNKYSYIYIVYYET